ncbi:MAG: enoyl-CoA hydratase/isomerase family protein [Desulfobacterota bacterium]|nr:enoyl-CoA hydratase/isomerase family protein [Thermodesulfobacteriota bacterium]
MEFVIYRKVEGIAVITFNRPEVLNAANNQMTREFLHALRQAEADSEVRVIVLRGEGRAFCAGHDLKEDTAGETLEQSVALIEELQETTRVMLRMGKPVIAAVQGYAVGAGCEWTMNCDLRIAAEGAKFGFPEASIGTTVTNAGTKLLTLLVGFGRSKELILTSRMIEAKEAKEWGLVNEVVPQEALEKTAMDLAGKIANTPVMSTRLAKAALNQAVTESFEQTLEREARDAMLMPIAGKDPSQ